MADREADSIREAAYEECAMLVCTHCGGRGSGVSTPDQSTPGFWLHTAPPEIQKRNGDHPCAAGPIWEALKHMREGK